jgi:hypothetical protein
MSASTVTFGGMLNFTKVIRLEAQVYVDSSVGTLK